MFVVRARKMQEARCLRGLFPLALVLLLGACFVMNINAHWMQLINPRTKPPPISSKLMKTRRTTSGTTSDISYRLDSWSQYDNPEEGAEREGDIYQSLKSRKTITTDKTLLWPNGIVNYYVHSSIVNEPSKFTVLEDALHAITSKTCIKFVRIQEHQKFPANSWVNITGHQRGCFSDLGRNAYGPTTLNLDVNVCFRTMGHAIHEMLHSLGVYHEHMRPDRDEYITIIWENVKQADAYNFRIMNNSVVTNYGLPYDYDSIMHYSMTAFSSNRSLPTIIPTKSYVEIGQRSHLSYYDTQKLLIAYKCNAVDTNKLQHNKKSNLEKAKEVPSRRRLPQQNKTVIETAKSQMPTIIIYNSITNKLDDKYADLAKSMDGSSQEVFLRSIHPIQPNYYPVPLSPIYPYINFHIYLREK